MPDTATSASIGYAVPVAHTVTAYPLSVERTTVPYRGDGPYPKKFYRQPAVSIRQLLLAAGPAAARRVTWRDSSHQRAGWHHHTTLVSAAHAFLTLHAWTQNPCAGMTLYAVFDACNTCSPEASAPAKPASRNTSSARDRDDEKPY